MVELMGLEQMSNMFSADKQIQSQMQGLTQGGMFIPQTQPQQQTMMPQPTGLPWNVHEMSWGTPSPPTLVHFTGQHPQTQTIKTGFPFKRKSQLQADIPNKQIKTDEAMAAHLNCLHISSDFTSHGKSDMALDFEEAGTSNNELLDRLKSRQIINYNGQLKNVERIVLCEEMRRLKSDPIIPESLMNKLEKPCMSLVLWKPPNKNTDIEKENQNSPVRRNNNKQSVLIPDTNAMDIEL